MANIQELEMTSMIGDLYDEIWFYVQHNMSQEVYIWIVMATVTRLFSVMILELDQRARIVGRYAFVWMTTSWIWSKYTSTSNHVVVHREYSEKYSAVLIHHIVALFTTEVSYLYMPRLSYADNWSNHRSSSMSRKKTTWTNILPIYQPPFLNQKNSAENH